MKTNEINADHSPDLKENIQYTTCPTGSLLELCVQKVVVEDLLLQGIEEGPAGLAVAQPMLQHFVHCAKQSVTVSNSMQRRK